MANPIESMFSLEGRVAIVTGGAGLLGRQYAEILLQAGARVAVADVRSEAAEQTAQEARAITGGQAISIGVDVSDKNQVTQMVNRILGEFGHMDILVNNAAIDPKFDADVAHYLTNTFEDYPLGIVAAVLRCKSHRSVSLLADRGERDGQTEGRSHGQYLLDLWSRWTRPAPLREEWGNRTNPFQTSQLCRDQGGGRSPYTLLGSLLGR